MTPPLTPTELESLVPWLLVSVEDANDLDYVTAEQRRNSMGGRLPR